MSNLHVILVKYTAPLEQVEAATPAHREWLDEHYRSGLFLTSGRKVDGTGGVLIAQAESQEQLEAVFKDDPFVLEAAPSTATRPSRRSSGGRR